MIYLNGNSLGMNTPGIPNWTMLDIISRNNDNNNNNNNNNNNKEQKKERKKTKNKNNKCFFVANFPARAAFIWKLLFIEVQFQINH